MKSNIQNKAELVNSVFSRVYKKYDLMNDVMSLGIHRLWKEKFIDWMYPLHGAKLIDVATGTGDIAKLFLDRTKNSGQVTCVEPNLEMLSLGKRKLYNYKTIKWINSQAEEIPVEDNVFDYYSISYGIRNVSDINKSLKEALRVLKPGGRFLCLEFSKIQNTNLETLYKNYSKLIPSIGQFVVGEKQPYEYLVKSIENFLNQEELIDAMVKSNFKKCTYRNLSGGIVSIHSGWKF